MIHNEIINIDTKTDKWVVYNSTSLGKNLSFDFTYLPNKWFKKIHKQIFIESMKLEKPSIATLQRYNAGHKRFFDFLKKYGIELDTYNDLTHQHTQMFLFEL